MSAPGDWSRRIADITTDSHTFTVTAEVFDGRKLIALDDHNLTVTQAADLAVALTRAVEVLAQT